MARYGFVFTLNNYTKEQELTLQGAVGQCGITYIIFGREVGEQGTPHLQGYLQSNQKMKDRFHKKLDIFVVPQKAPKAIDAILYCKKDGDFYESGEPDNELKGTGGKKQGKRSDLDEVKEAINQGGSYEDICTTHFDTAARFSQFIKERIQARDTEKEQASLREALESSSLRPWQKALLDVVQEEPHPRRIHWIWEGKGNAGKSWMATYLAVMEKALVLDYGKKADLAYIFANQISRTVIFDLSRTTEPGDNDSKKLDHLYALAELLKNGRLVTTKYNSRTVTFRPPHVIFFANFPPDMTKWSEDRYFIKEI